MSKFLWSAGLELEAPVPGDIVTVKLRPCPRPATFASLYSGGIGTKPLIEDESTNPQHYRHTNIFEVLACNGGQAVVKRLWGYDAGRKEIWPISAHIWYDARELWAALKDGDAE